MKKRLSALYIAIILLVSVAGALFVYPNKLTPWLDKLQPWKLGLDLVGGSHLIYKIDMSQVPDSERSRTASGLKDVIERRVNLFGVREPQVFISQSGGEYNLIIELAGISDISQAIKEIGATPYLDFREIIEKDGTTYAVPTALNGKYLKKAEMIFNQTTGAPEVSLELKDDGPKIFGDLTEKNIGKPICIYLDGKPIVENESCPMVREKISDGKALITSPAFTSKSVKTLVERFNAGALPAPISLINQQNVGASLGKDSLDKSIIAGIVGTILIMLFLVVYYGFFGVIACLALIIYIILSLSIFKVFVTMSLAGIAGFLLSIGMAVDANVLIFERAKEEIKRGLSRTAAIKEGFKRAWTSIRDSNISTIITSLILFNFTSSFVKGLALTLLIGVLVSMFTAITVTRHLLNLFIKDKVEDNEKKL